MLKLIFVVIDLKSSLYYSRAILLSSDRKEWLMNKGKTVFAQIMDFLPMHEFRRCVRRYRGNYKVKSYSCLDQYLCMAFAQLTYRESLRDIVTCLRFMAHRRMPLKPRFGLPFLSMSLLKSLRYGLI